MSVSLKTGWNLVVYPGKAQSAGDAFASISSYISGVYYWDSVAELYKLVVGTTIMVPYACYWIEVTQNCTWTYGPDETAPTSVQLYEGWNYVPYLGPAQTALDAFASIGIWPAGYLVICQYWDNVTQAWIQVTADVFMIPKGTYAVVVSQDCVWTFAAAPAFGGELVNALVWWERKDGWSPIGETNAWPANTPLTTALMVKNTGNQTAIFKVKFMGLTSGGVQLSPGETATFYLYPTTPSAGTYSYTLSILAADQVVKTYPIQVTTAAVPTEPEFSGFGISDYSKV